MGDVEAVIQVEGDHLLPGVGRVQRHLAQPVPADLRHYAVQEPASKATRRYRRPAWNWLIWAGLRGYLISLTILSAAQG